MSYIGSNKLGKMYLGSTAIGKAYLGSDLVYSSAGGGTPVLPYDAEIEYLQTTGTQYIDTGIVSGTNIVAEIKAILTQTSSDVQTFLCARTGNNVSFSNLLSIKNVSTPYTQIGGGNSSIDSSADPTVLHTYRTGLQNNSLFFETDGTTEGTRTISGSTSNLSMYLFARHTDSGADRGIYSKLYYCKITKDGSLVRDFIPVRVGQTGYLYDKVSGELFGNNGSGSFILGNDIEVTPVSTYTSLSYIKFTGSQWILTDYHPNPKTHLVIDMQFENNGNLYNGTGNQWIGCYNNTVGAFLSNFGGNASQYYQLFYWFEKPYVSSTWTASYGSIFNRSTFTYLNNKVTFQGVNTTTETKTTTQDGCLTLGVNETITTIFDRHNLKIFSMKIYEDNVLLHEYLPKTDGTNNGLYDTVTDTFITSQTATNLVGE